MGSGFSRCSNRDQLLRAEWDSGDPYDVAVLDSILPGLKGMELASVIREVARFNTLKLKLLASIGKKGVGAFAERAGIDGYLIKLIGLSP